MHVCRPIQYMSAHVFVCMSVTIAIVFVGSGNRHIQSAQLMVERRSCAQKTCGEESADQCPEMPLLLGTY